MPDSEKYIIITGASDGLGLRLAHLFADDQVRLLLTGRKQFDELVHLLPPQASYLTADQTQPNCGELILEKVKQLGWPRVDNVVLNASTGVATEPGDELAATITDTLEVNLLAPIAILHHLSPLILVSSNKNAKDYSHCACITFIGSPARKGAAKFASYAASKAGISGLARALNSEWQKRADVQIIHPGPTNTQMQKKAGLDLGKMQNLFIDPDYCASQIKRLIDARKPTASIGMMRYYGYLILSKLKLMPPAKPVIYK